MSIQNSSRPVKSGDDANPFAGLYERSSAAVYGISETKFAEILDEIRGKYFPQNPDASAPEKSDFGASLHVEELALARGCAAGDERAWQDFISRYRQKLHRMAIHITRDSTHAEELADSLFADLYGVNLRDGVRISKLVSYTGRGSLEGWLRTVMAQEFINRYRKQKRTVSLEEQTEEGAQFTAPVPAQESVPDRRLETVTDEALAELSSEDRFTLAAYFLDGRTLAEIARILGLHESSVSRRLDRLATALRKRILAGLRTLGMSHAQATEALETDVRDLKLNLGAHLTQDCGVKAFPERRISNQNDHEASNG